MKKETVNDMIVELDKLFFDREEKFKNLEKYFETLMMIFLNL